MLVSRGEVDELVEIKVGGNRRLARQRHQQRFCADQCP